MVRRRDPFAQESPKRSVGKHEGLPGEIFGGAPRTRREQARMGDQNKAVGSSNLPTSAVPGLPPKQNNHFVLAVTGAAAG
jgi:hypothetical protein